MKTSNIARIITVFVSLSLFLASCAMPGATPEATATAAATATPAITSTPTIAPTATNTPKPTVTLTIPPTPNMTATQMYTDFVSKLHTFYEAKYITSEEGTFKHLADFTKEFAKINYLQWYETGESPTNFVLDTDIAWDSASAAANNSGCGVFFHIKDSDNFYTFYVSLKGIVQMQALNNNSWTRLGTAVYGSARQKGGVKLTLIVQDSVYRVLINDKLVKTYQGSTGKLLHGQLAYTVLSGTNKSFGTRCNFTNTVLWTLP
jgi:hypothetical protein